VCTTSPHEQSVYRLVVCEYYMLAVVLSILAMSNQSSGMLWYRSKTGRACTNQPPFQFPNFHLSTIPSTSLADWLVKLLELLIHGEIFTLAMLNTKTFICLFIFRFAHKITTVRLQQTRQSLIKGKGS